MTCTTPCEPTCQNIKIIFEAQCANIKNKCVHSLKLGLKALVPIAISWPPLKIWIITIICVIMILCLVSGETIRVHTLL